MKSISHIVPRLVSALCLLTVIAFGNLVSAEDLRFSNLLGDEAVLQRDKPVMIRGFAEPGTEVTVSFGDQTRKAASDETGQWRITLDAMPASADGRDMTLSAAGAEPVTLKNVVVGDVILFARQTLVDISLGRTDEGKAIASKVSPDPSFRVMRIRTIPTMEPQAEVNAEALAPWQIVDADAASAMSGAAFHYGRSLAGEVDVPVGIIDLNLGPNFTIGWISREAIAKNDDYYGDKTPLPGYADFMEERVEKYKAQEGMEGTPGDTKWVWSDPVKDPMYPAAGYNAVLAPMRDYALKAVLLQLGTDYPYMGYERLREEGKATDRDVLDVTWGETYTHRKNGYRAGIQIVPRLPGQWRGYFGDGKLPLAFILPPNTANSTFAIHLREVRELQRQTAEANRGVGLIVAGTDHIPFSGQPSNDALLAERSLAWTLGEVYNREGAVASGPLFDRFEANYNKAQIFFADGTADGLTAKDDSLDRFEVAGVDGVFSPAKAVIDGDTIRLESDAVSRIANVRFNFTSYPLQGLVNNAGLPAIPFHTGKTDFVDVPRSGETSLPPEYSTPASEWTSGDVAIISGGGADYKNGPGWLGATGLRVLPFGPNMRVTVVLPDSPADGKIEVGDMIYKVNGELLEDEHLPQVGRAVALAESEEGAGKISFSLRRGKKLLDVDLKLEVLGQYSVTSPYDCPKTDRIIANSEAYLAQRGGLATGYAGGGWLYSDIIFLLGAGTPEHQGLVRRFIYDKIDSIETSPDGTPGGQSWHKGHAVLLFAEYYLATGDRTVLPYLKAYADAFTLMQCREGTFGEMPPRSIGGWRHNYPGGQWYGMIPMIGLPGMMGLHLSEEAGVEIDDEAYELARDYFRDKQAEMGHVSYAAVAPAYDAPDPIDADALANGMLYAGNGGRAMTAIFFALEGDTRIAHLNSLYTAFAWNNCHEGHASNFFNGLWTPLGARVHSKDAFINFMRNHYWYRDLKRMYNHVSIPAVGDAPGVGHDLALLVPRQRLRILGAPESVFAADAPEELKPALDEYYAKDYGTAEQLTGKLLADARTLAPLRGRASQLQRAAQDLQESIDFDLAKVERLIDEGRYFEASLDLPQLTAVLPEGDAHLAELTAAIEGVDAKVFANDEARYKDERKALAFNPRALQRADDAKNWTSLTTVAKLDSRGRPEEGMVDPDDATVWRMKVVESMSQSPEGWQDVKFDDSDWLQTSLPISWHLNHTFLARTRFNVDNVSEIEALRLGCHPYRQLNIQVFINGELVAKFNECENVGGWVYGDLPPAAKKLLRNGENTIAFATTNDWRWSSRGGVRNKGFDLKLDAQLKE